jgi:phosphoribosylanthranilate isomerase
MFQIKICGITNPVDALTAVHAGADALGLNFYPKSPRGISLEVARRIASVLPPEPQKVGVFVNASVEYVIEIHSQLQLNLVQIHGDESPAYLAELGDRPTIRAFRLTADGLTPIVNYLNECKKLGVKLQAILLDAHQSGQYGGTGKTTDWTTCAQYVNFNKYPPLILSGGLTPSNVAQAIRAVGPAAVDTASGVEISPGQKDPDAIAAFVQAARHVFTNFSRHLNILHNDHE